MKRVISVLAGLLFFLILISVCDFFIKSPNLETERTAALQYLKNEKLETPPRVFTHDGCTLFPDVLPGHDFKQACLVHDIQYWAGGEIERKSAADNRFYDS